MSKKKIERELKMKVKMIGSAIKRSPDNPAHFFRRGILYTKLRRYNLAISDYTESIRLNPRFYQAYKNRGRIFSELRRYRECIRDSTMAIDLNDTLTQAYNNRGYSYFQIREYEKSIVDYSKVMELDPNDNVARTNVEMCERRRDEQLRLDNQRQIGLVEEFQGPPIKVKAIERLSDIPHDFTGLVEPQVIDDIPFEFVIEVPPALNPNNDPLVLRQLILKDCEVKVEQYSTFQSSTDLHAYGYVPNNVRGDATLIAKFESPNNRRFTLVKENAFNFNRYQKVRKVERKEEEEDGTSTKEEKEEESIQENLILKGRSKRDIYSRFKSIIRSIHEEVDISLMYRKNLFYDFNERIQNGFYDQGREKRFMLFPDLTDEKVDEVFETIVINLLKDRNLSPFFAACCRRVSYFLKTAERALSTLESATKEKRKEKCEYILRKLDSVRTNMSKKLDYEKEMEILAKHCEFIKNIENLEVRYDIERMIAFEIGFSVGEYFGGWSDTIAFEAEERTRSHIRRLEGNKVLLGEYAGGGVCRHRALLFKMLCDAAGLACRILRGSVVCHGSRNSHVWNEIRIMDEFIFVDCNYSKIIVTRFDEINHYETIGRAKSMDEKVLETVRSEFYKSEEYLKILMSEEFFDLSKFQKIMQELDSSQNEEVEYGGRRKTRSEEEEMEGEEEEDDDGRKMKKTDLEKAIYVVGKWYCPVQRNKILWMCQKDKVKTLRLRREEYECSTLEKPIYRSVEVIGRSEPLTLPIHENGIDFDREFDPFMMRHEAWKSGCNLWMGLTHDNIVKPMCSFPFCGIAREKLIDCRDVFDLIFKSVKCRCTKGQIFGELTYFFLCIARGLRYLHGCGVVHFNLNPSSLLVDFDYEREVISTAKISSLFRWKEIGQKIKPVYFSTTKSKFIDCKCTIASPKMDIFSFGKIMLEFKDYYSGYYKLDVLAERCVSKNIHDRPTANDIVNELVTKLTFLNYRLRQEMKDKVVFLQKKKIKVHRHARREPKTFEGLSFVCSVCKNLVIINNRDWTVSHTCQQKTHKASRSNTPLNSIRVKHTLVSEFGENVHSHRMKDPNFLRNLIRKWNRMKLMNEEEKKNVIFECNHESCPCPRFSGRMICRLSKRGFDLIGKAKNVKRVICQACGKEVEVDAKSQTFNHKECELNNILDGKSMSDFRYLHVIRKPGSKAVLSTHETDLGVLLGHANCKGSREEICKNKRLRGRNVVKVGHDTVTIISESLETPIKKRLRCKRCQKPVVIREDREVSHKCDKWEKSLYKEKMKLNRIKFVSLRKESDTGKIVKDDGTKEEFLKFFKRGGEAMMDLVSGETCISYNLFL